jgi:hypothetical protein
VLAATLLIPVLILEADGHGGWLTSRTREQGDLRDLRGRAVAVLYAAERKEAALCVRGLEVAIVLLAVPTVADELRQVITEVEADLGDIKGRLG